MRQALHSTGWCKVTLGMLAGAALVWAGRWATGDTQPTPASPIGEKFWQSEFGAEDQRGAAKRITPEAVVSAARLIRNGSVYQLGRVYEYGRPLPGKRHYSLTIPGLPTGQPAGSNQMVYNDELFRGEIGQIGTQFDGLGHLGIRMNGEEQPDCHSLASAEHTS
jgi:hypothetical protein